MITTSSVALCVYSVDLSVTIKDTEKALRTVEISVIQLFNYSVIQLFSYSLLIAFTGFAVAAFMAWKPTVSKTMQMVNTATTASKHHGMLVR